MPLLFPLPAAPEFVPPLLSLDILIERLKGPDHHAHDDQNTVPGHIPTPFIGLHYHFSKLVQSLSTENTLPFFIYEVIT